MAAKGILHRLRRDERGFTMTELLVVSAGLFVILGAILGLMDVANQIAPSDRERVHAVREAQTGLERMTRELRQAHDIAISAAGLTATAQVLKNGTAVTVTYDCSGAPVDGLRKCVRTQSSGGVAALTVIERVANAANRPVFTATARDNHTTYVRALIEVPSRGERPVGGTSRVVLDDGFYLRNVDALH
ncbi:MAG TPA: type II secretion system protein [Solirubrobacteraceae bacterium]|nr:type II secretion system protein [Solirubrobacteraceae bacterium]